MRKRLIHDALLDPRPGVIAILAAATGLMVLLLPLAQGMPFTRNAHLHAGLVGLAWVLGCVASAWWWRLALESLMQHLLVLRRCGCCGHPEKDRGPRLSSVQPFACRTWRCVECGSEWVGTGAFVDAETRRDAA